MDHTTIGTNIHRTSSMQYCQTGSGKSIDTDDGQDRYESPSF
jgi:hypothetical protein